MSPAERPERGLGGEGEHVLGLPFMSLGAWVILTIGVVSSLILWLWPVPVREGMEFWIFAKVHEETYGDLIEQWNREAARTGRQPVRMYVIDGLSLIRRTLSAFWAGTPVADLMEVERDQIGFFVAGPLETIGFVDLTERLEHQGLDQRINPPSFSPWTSRGHVFGIPHDIHPVVLAYRADVYEAAGIDLTKVQTWDEFAEVVRAVQTDLDGDGTIDRWAINLWPTNMQLIETLLLQEDGGTFDAEDRLIIDCPQNAHILATVVSWCYGPGRIAIDAPEFNPSGHQLRVEGRVLGAIMPDWLAGVWKQDLPQLAGKVKVMPLPAWRPGGRRTSVMGGTMLAITRSSKHFEDAWAFAQYLYFSEEHARRLWKRNVILSPMRDLWSLPFYYEPDPYFCHQVLGPIFMELAPQVPRRPSSPFRSLALTRLSQVLHSLVQYAQATRTYDRERLEERAKVLLKEAAERMRYDMSRNLFHAGELEKTAWREGKEGS